MSIFDVRAGLIGRHEDYFSSFVTIRDERIQDLVEREIEDGRLWPDPLIQLNPLFEPGATIGELAGEGVLHPECEAIFSRKGSDHERGAGNPLRLYRHQEEAIRLARTGESFVLTTGTGSGKSLGYMVPIVDDTLWIGSGRGTRAIIVYPMNALANSQMEELAKFLGRGYPEGAPPVTYARYTGQESEAEREAIRTQPPDILLTNYVMLELLLTREKDREVIENARGLRFLVLDELHTYRGRQGADVAMLVRRVRERIGGDDLQVIGTSATLAAGGEYEEQRREVAEVTGRVFGAPVKPDHVIGETLRRSTTAAGGDGEATRLRERVRAQDSFEPESFEAFLDDPLAAWIETTFGVETEPGSERRVRAAPRSIAGPGGGAELLAELTGLAEDVCAGAIERTLLAGGELSGDGEGSRAFNFRLHQFISGGDTVYASIGPADRRTLALKRQDTVPDTDHVLLPLAFCRECGQEYYVVRRTPEGTTTGRNYSARELGDLLRGEEDLAGYLYYSEDDPWPESEEEVQDRLPTDWLDRKKDGFVIRRSRRGRLPRAVTVTASGQEASGGLDCQYIPAPLGFCLACGVAYMYTSRSEFTRLGQLGAEGRSSATTTLGISTLQGLEREQERAAGTDLPRKILSFTDNRQDASLQAGHFNDFVEVAMLRGALYRAARKAGEEGLHHDVLPARVAEQLGLDFADYARNPEAVFGGRRNTEQALRDVVAYRLYRDLQRGWRVTMPNLEQVGLLEFDYLDLAAVSGHEDSWQHAPQVLVDASAAQRERAMRTLLDHMRHGLALYVDFLDPDFHDQLKQRSGQYLKAPWALDEDDRLHESTVVYPYSRGARGEYTSGRNLYVSGRGTYGYFLDKKVFRSRHLRIEEREEIIRFLLDGPLAAADLVLQVERPEREGGTGYQIKASSLLWRAGDGQTPSRDPLRVTREAEGGGRVNPFFLDLYRSDVLRVGHYVSREHTAQVDYPDRLERERQFREGELPVLFCSPTMELGVDIADLNVVNLRNVPPTPANYAQRSGRAGRSGQPALVYTYCSSWSAHDQHFFRRPRQMVSGGVRPPRIDLANEDLVRSHVHAIWLAEAQVRLGNAISEIVDTEADGDALPSLELDEEIRDALSDVGIRERTRRKAAALLETIEDEPGAGDWLTDTWLDQVLTTLPRAFEQALERWREMYRTALAQARESGRRLNDDTLPYGEKRKHERLEREARHQLDLLRQSDGTSVHSDFYSYRYLASEGFLPGYNFPRLPLTAFVPGRRGSGRDDYLSRPRFLAISEFGPRAFIYHEGSRYQIVKVDLPVSEEGERLALQSVKLCDHCGYHHEVAGGPGPDRCEFCDAPLGMAMSNLFRLRKVTTRRRNKINSDEENRQRMGYDLRTSFRFAEREQGVAARRAAVHSGDGEDLMELTYAPSAEVWRINLGWSRQKNGPLGFDLDEATGYWGSNSRSYADTSGDELGPQIVRVVPFVRDSRNALLVDPRPLGLERGGFLSLLYALKQGIQRAYQLEDSELAVVPMPDADRPTHMLLYEASEGGAGVLRRLTDDPDALAQVARAALEICHFNPDTGAGVEEAEGESCGKACYDCLLAYTNQPHHEVLDRHAIRQVLLELAAGAVHGRSGARSREEQLEFLREIAGGRRGSSLEVRWLEMIDELGLRLPSGAHERIDELFVEPDFLYRSEKTVIFIDGPPHQGGRTRRHDLEADERLSRAGLLALRFPALDGWGPEVEEAWRALLAKYPSIFGALPEEA